MKSPWLPGMSKLGASSRLYGPADLTQGGALHKRSGGPAQRLHAISELTSAFYRPSPRGRAQAKRSAAMDTHREVVDEEEHVVDVPMLYLAGLITENNGSSDRRT